MEEKTLLVSAVALKKHFVIKKSIIKKNVRVLKAVDGVDLRIHEGEIVGLVGESGCGKSTLGRSLLRLHSITSGDVWFDNNVITRFNNSSMLPFRKDMQMIFQDPFASLNPRKTIYDSIREPLDVHNIGNNEDRDNRVKELLDYVGLGKNIYKYPHEMSGGQRQRVVIARAVVMKPRFVVCDEPVSALDVSVRAQVLNLMEDLKERNNMAYLFISHDLSVVRYLCDTIAVMYLGKIVEVASKAELFNNPVHPYTKALLSAIPIPDVDKKMNKIVLSGDVPSPLNPPAGCRFHTRCPYATERCSKEMPAMKRLNDNHSAACFFAE
ncbi:MAG: ABC transporter ATP-binding protein [Eubacteriales bacterium]|nr:ABC transporter ATP-binding protein [Eubacteriales bacterium]